MIKWLVAAHSAQLQKQLRMQNAVECIERTAPRRRHVLIIRHGVMSPCDRGE